MDNHPFTRDNIVKVRLNKNLIMQGMKFLIVLTNNFQRFI